jgi:hypothetical protein
LTKVIALTKLPKLSEAKPAEFKCRPGPTLSLHSARRIVRAPSPSGVLQRVATRIRPLCTRKRVIAKSKILQANTLETIDFEPLTRGSLEVLINCQRHSLNYATPPTDTGLFQYCNISVDGRDRSVSCLLSWTVPLEQVLTK